MRRFLTKLGNLLVRRHAGLICAGLCFVVGLLWAIFGFWKTLLILCLTLAGYIFGARFLSDPEDLQRLLDKLIPPGRFR